MSPEASSKASSKADVLRRLHCAEGQLRGIRAMVERGDHCLLILRQTNAVQGALREVTRLVWRDHLRHDLGQHLCAAAGDPARQAEWVAEVTTLYESLRA